MPDPNNLDLQIQGMTCAACVSHVEKALRSVPGVSRATVNLATQRARVGTENAVDAALLVAAVARMGYGATLVAGASESTDSLPNSQPTSALEVARTQSRRDLRQLILSALLSAPLLMPMIAPWGVHAMIPPGIALALATVVQLIFGARFYRSAYLAMRAGFANMDLLIALGTTAAYGLSIFHLTQAQSLVATFPQYPLYFESSAMVITLVRLGKFLELRARAHASDAIRALQRLRPELALRLVNGQEVEVPIARLALGDQVVVRPGERIAADGVIVQGQSYVDAALLTGESVPIACGPGDRVIGGAVNQEGRLIVAVQALGAETLLAQIIRQVEDAQAAKAPMQKLVDRVSAVFVPVVMAIAIVTALIWGFGFSQWDRGILNAVAVLVIACPCALGLATPISIMVGTGVASRAGILIKDAEALEGAHRIQRVAFDKTGTLTEGKLKLTLLRPTRAISSPELLNLAAAVQAGSQHPLAQAVLRAATENGLTTRLPFSESRAWPGRGVSAQVEYRGQRKEFGLGSARWMQELGIDLSELQSTAQTLEALGQTVSWLAQLGLTESKVLGLLAFSDTVKPQARAAIQRLEALGIQTLLLTGDNAGSAQVVAQTLGIREVHAELLPAQKAERIQKLRDQGVRVAMVGDGINDAPALATADLSIAMASGTDVAMQTAGITLMRGDPWLVPAALEISRRTYGKIRQNLFWAMVYNVVGIPLAAAGYLNPMVAGAAMALSSVSVVLNSLRLGRALPAPSQIGDSSAA